MKVIKNAVDRGSATETNFVNMGAFGITVLGQKNWTYLKSTGFGSCIGLVLHLARDKGINNVAVGVRGGLLAHFMSDNDIPASFPVFFRELLSTQGDLVPGPVLVGPGNAIGSDWEGCVFHGDKIKDTFKSKTSDSVSAIRSNKVARKRATTIIREANSVGIKNIEYVDDGFGSAVLDIATGELLLFNESGVLGSEPAPKNLFAFMDKPLQFNGK